MSNQKYEFEVRAPQSGINRDLDAFDRRVAKSLAGVEKFKAEIRTLGKDFSGLATFAAELGKVHDLLKLLASDAGSAEGALADVGKNNRSIGTLTGRLEKLDAELKQKVIDANAAEAALARVGTGGPLGAGRNGNGGGGGDQHAMLRGAVRKAMGAGLLVTGLVAKAAGANAREKREFLQAARNRTVDLRKDLAEYANLRDEKGGPTDRIVDEVTSFAMETGASVDEAATYLTAYEGSAPTGRDKGNVGGARPGGKANAAQADLDRRLAVIGGKFGAAAGIDAKTAGDLAGVVGQYTKIARPEDFARELGAMHYGLDKGRGAISTLARSELGAAGSSIAEDFRTGKLTSLGELGAWIGVTSSTSKTGASSGTSYRQISRLLNTLPGDGGEGDWLKSIGVAGARGDTAKLNKLADYFKAHPDLRIVDELNRVGFGNSTDRDAVAGMIANRDVLNQRIAEGKKVAGRDVIDRLATHQRSLQMQTQHAAVAEEVSVVEQGKRQEKIEIGRANARAALLNRDKLKVTGFKESLRDTVFDWTTWGAENGEQIRVDTEMVQQLRDRAAKVGIKDATGNLAGIMLKGIVGGKDEESFRAEYARQYDRVVAAENGPQKAGQAMQQAAQALNQAAQAVNQLQGPPGGNAGGRGFVPGRR